MNWAKIMDRVHGNKILNNFAMFYKYLFFFSSYLEKKYDPIGDPYIPAYMIVSETITFNFFLMVNIVFILLIQDDELFHKWMGITPYIGVATFVLAAMYFRRNGRRDKIYEEVRQTSTRKKIRYGIWCLLYVVLSFGLWIITNDVIHVLGNGPKLSYAKKIVEVLSLSCW